MTHIDIFVQSSPAQFPFHLGSLPLPAHCATKRCLSEGSGDLMTFFLNEIPCITETSSIRDQKKTIKDNQGDEVWSSHDWTKNICEIFTGESDSPPSWIQRSKTKLEYLQEAVLVEYGSMIYDVLWCSMMFYDVPWWSMNKPSPNKNFDVSLGVWEDQNSCRF